MPTTREMNLQSAVQPVTMPAAEAARLADGGRVWAMMPDGGSFYRTTVTYQPRNRVLFDAGWGTCTLRDGDKVIVDTGRLA